MSLICEEVKDNEAIYDSEIAPLMTSIIAICKAHGIPMVASFAYAPDQLCTTNLPGPDDDQASMDLRRAYVTITRGRPAALLAITITKEQA